MSESVARILLRSSDDHSALNGPPIFVSIVSHVVCNEHDCAHSHRFVFLCSSCSWIVVVRLE